MTAQRLTCRAAIGLGARWVMLAASALLLVAIIAMRSGWSSKAHGLPLAYAVLDRGYLMLGHSGSGAFCVPISPQSDSGLTAKHFWTITWASGGSVRVVWIPAWLVLAPLAGMTISLWSLGPLRRMRRRLMNRCVVCGYSLAGLADARCPECGTALQAKEPSR